MRRNLQSYLCETNTTQIICDHLNFAKENNKVFIRKNCPDISATRRKIKKSTEAFIHAKKAKTDN